LADKAGVDAAISAKTKQLEDLAKEKYSSSQLSKVDTTFTYTIALDKSETILWATAGVAKTRPPSTRNYQHIKMAFKLAGKDVPLSQFQKLDYASNGQQCRAYVTALSNWQGGENHLSTVVTFDASINDGSTDYAAGKQTYDFTVYVKP